MRELAKGRNIDEEKDIWDKVEAIREYARQAKNKQLEIDAAEIKRRWFEFLGDTVQRADGGEGTTCPTVRYPFSLTKGRRRSIWSRRRTGPGMRSRCDPVVTFAFLFLSVEMHGREIGFEPQEARARRPEMAPRPSGTAD